MASKTTFIVERPHKCANISLNQLFCYDVYELFRFKAALKNSREQTIVLKMASRNFLQRSFAVSKKSEISQSDRSKFSVTQRILVTNSCPPSFVQSSID